MEQGWAAQRCEAEQTVMPWGELRHGYHTEDGTHFSIQGVWARHDPNRTVTKTLSGWTWCYTDSPITHWNNYPVWGWFCFFIFLCTIKNITQAKIPAVIKNKDSDKRISGKKQVPACTANHATLLKISQVLARRVNAKQNLQNHRSSIPLFPESFRDFIISPSSCPPSQLPSSPYKNMQSPRKLFSWNP